MFSQNNKSLNQDMNPEPHKYKAATIFGNTKQVNMATFM